MHGRFVLVVLCVLFAGVVLGADNGTAAPLSIPPSLYWDGDDGYWSTFEVQVGTPGQTVRLLPCTSANPGSTTWAIIPEGCVDVNPNMTDCGSARGGLFYSNRSSSWSTQGLVNEGDSAVYGLATYEESILGLGGDGSYGYDTITFGDTGSGLPSLEHQVVAGVWTNDFFLGSLGLSPVPFNFTSLNDPKPSMLSALRNQSLIPSRSWAYTAGAHYQEPPVFGSLTLGGYDTTRLKSNNVTFPFGADFSRDLLVQLNTITYDTAGSSPLLAQGISIFIDSLVSEIWLPVATCEAFATQFNLTWNEQGQLYQVSEKAHAALLNQNPKFTFTIGQIGGSGETVDIVLPYAAFDLNLTQPIVDSSLRYFPLKRAQNSTQYTLGRTFLQEAYVIADYDNHNFSVSQALFPSTGVAQNIVAIHPPGYKASSSNGSNSSSSSSSLSGGAIAGIVIGALAGLVLLALAAFVLVKRHRRRRDLLALPIHEKDAKSDDPSTPMQEMDAQWKRSEMSAFEGSGGRHELASKDGGEHKPPISAARVHELPSAHVVHEIGSQDHLHEFVHEADGREVDPISPESKPK